MSSLNQLSLKIAHSQIGVQEVPKNSNAGPAVESYLKSVGLGKGYAWCMAFVYWSVKQAAIELKLQNPLIKTAGVLRQWNEIQPRFKSKVPNPGDIFIMDFGKGQGHTGFVVKVFPNSGLIETIEGNTNNDGSREGYEVAYRTRKISAMKGFIRIPN